MKNQFEAIKENVATKADLMEVKSELKSEIATLSKAVSDIENTMKNIKKDVVFAVGGIMAVSLTLMFSMVGIMLSN